MTFDFYPVPRIQFGVGQFDKLPDALRPLGTRVLVVHNADALLPRLNDLLKDVPHATFRQHGEPTTCHVERAVALAKQERCDCLVALGGGSAIDCAKAVAALLTNEGVPLDYMEVVGRGKKITNPCAPWIAIPTTAGTGAEATRNAVIALSPPPSSPEFSPLPRTRGEGSGTGDCPRPGRVRGSPVGRTLQSDTRPRAVDVLIHPSRRELP